MLIVDDSACSRTLIRLSVKDLDVKIIGEAENGKEGVDKYLKLVPDIVTMDLAMDDGCGIDALKEIIEINHNAVVIVVSSVGGQDLIVKEALELGAKKVFDKPFDGERFAEYIKETWL
jgi:two-component system chemotaxis response regulator CheY